MIKYVTWVMDRFLYVTPTISEPFTMSIDPQLTLPELTFVICCRYQAVNAARFAILVRGFTVRL